MGIFDLVTNTVEGVVETTVGTAKLVAAPVTNLVDLEEDHFGDAAKNITNGLTKIGDPRKSKDD